MRVRRGDTLVRFRVVELDRRIGGDREDRGRIVEGRELVLDVDDLAAGRVSEVPDSDLLVALAARGDDVAVFREAQRGDRALVLVA